MRCGAGLASLVLAISLVGGCSTSGDRDDLAASSPDKSEGSGASSAPSSAGSSARSLAELRAALRPKGIKCSPPEPPPPDLFPPPGTHLDQRMGCHAHDISLIFWSGEPGEIDEAIDSLPGRRYCSEMTKGASMVEGGWYFVISQSDHSPDAIGTQKEKATMRRMHRTIAEVGGGKSVDLVPGC